MRLLLSIILAASCAAARETPADRLTLSGGWTREISGYSFQGKPTAPGLGISYGHRFHRFIEAEAGLFTALNPTGNLCFSYGCVDVDDRYYWIPFGVRFVAPLYLGRIEFSGGGGGLYEKYTTGASPGGGPLPHDGWGGYFVGSAAVSLDHARHFWVAATPRWFLANPAYTRDRWFQISGEFSIRFR